jgi:hypothetical protein
MLVAQKDEGRTMPGHGENERWERGAAVSMVTNFWDATNDGGETCWVGAPLSASQQFTAMPC